MGYCYRDPRWETETQKNSTIFLVTETLLSWGILTLLTSAGMTIHQDLVKENSGVSQEIQAGWK